MHPLRDHGGVGIGHPKPGEQTLKREQRLQTRCLFKRPLSGSRGHSWRWGGYRISPCSQPQVWDLHPIVFIKLDSTTGPQFSLH